MPKSHKVTRLVARNQGLTALYEAARQVSKAVAFYAVAELPVSGRHRAAILKLESDANRAVVSLSLYNDREKERHWTGR